MPRKRNHSSDSSSSSSPSSSSSSSSAEEEFEAETKKKSSKPLPKIMPSDSSSSSDDDDGEWNAKPKVKSKPKRNKTVQKKPLKTSKKKLKSSLSDSEDNNGGGRDRKRSEEKEEGEVDFSDDELEEFNDGFDDNLMGDEEDKIKLAQMTEKEREQELFNRSEKREVLKTRFEIEKKLRLAKKQVNKTDSKENNTETNKNNNNDKTATVDKVVDNLAFLEHSASRSVERRRNMEDKRKVKDAMKGLKAEREKKKLKQKLMAADVFSDSSDSNDSDDETETNTEQRKIGKKSIKKSSTSEDYSSSSSVSDDDDVESIKKSDSRKRDNDWDHKFDHNDPIEQFDFTIDHLNSIRLSRFKMEKWCHAPFFKDTVMNSFVRIGVGNTANISQYIVGQIVDVVETAKIYPLGKTRTNKGIKLRHGNNMEKIFRLEYVSNSEFTVNEFEQWRTKMIAGRCDFPTKDLVENKKIDIQKAINYNYSEEDVVMIVAEKERFKDKPVNFAMKKTQLLKDKEYAELKGDHEKAQEISKEIDRLEEESKKLDKLRTQSIAPISFINERNRMKNIKEAERAIAEAAKEAQNNKDDPFTRRKCTPTMIHVFKSKQSQNENQSNMEDNNNNNSSQMMAENKNNILDSNQPDSIMDMDNRNQNNNNNNNNNNSATRTSNDANDMFSVHDFDIKIDFNGLNNVAGLNSATASNMSNSNSSSFSNSFLSGISNGFANARSNPMSTAATNRRSLNLDEYKKKKGLI